MRGQLVAVENHVALVFLVFHEFNGLSFDAIRREGYFSTFQQEGRNVPLVLPVIVTRLILQSAERLLLH